jgi:hypothetical protein
MEASLCQARPPPRSWTSTAVRWYCQLERESMLTHTSAPPQDLNRQVVVVEHPRGGGGRRRRHYYIARGIDPDWKQQTIRKPAPLVALPFCYHKIGRRDSALPIAIPFFRQILVILGPLCSRMQSHKGLWPHTTAPRHVTPCYHAVTISQHSGLVTTPDKAPFGCPGTILFRVVLFGSDRCHVSTKKCCSVGWAWNLIRTGSVSPSSLQGPERNPTLYTPEQFLRKLAAQVKHVVSLDRGLE